MKQKMMNVAGMNECIADFFKFVLDRRLFLSRVFFMQLDAQDGRLFAKFAHTHQCRAFYFGMRIKNRFDLLGKQWTLCGFDPV